ncbi:cytochrome P450 [Streptomyces phaeolivaceus]|uniref:Cytochrome P450 n=1 Tax=Streptomyces phaeolivaceus TaxID=2653200 RepID=A0A5P8KD57_9ACTN|nr:cytochrome P450 [Streptomyces phaeolivaceus]QFR00470.1 cytochrome P450 [Streptomyces phaeolivaceus]
MPDLDTLPYPGDQGEYPLDTPGRLARWQEEEPVRRIAVPGDRTAWLVTRHHDIRTALMDSRLSADRNRPGFPHLRTDEPPMPKGTFSQYDPPEHTVVRRMLTKAFMPKNIERLKPRIRHNVDGLLDAMAQKPHPVNLHEAFGLPLPTLTMCELLGVPYGDRTVFQDNTQQILDLTLPGEEVVAAFGRMLSYLGDLLDAKARAPQDDLVSDLAVNRVSTGELPKEEAVGVLALLLLAGHDTTANFISLGTITLLRNPEQLRRLLGDTDAVPAAVEELLRYLPLLHTGIRRIATADLEIGGVTVRAGEGVILAITAGNRDPRAFEKPEVLDLDRGWTVRGHLAWGHGIHQCVGQSLARAQLQIALPALFERFPGLRLAVDFNEVAFRDNTLFYGVHELPVVW